MFAIRGKFKAAQRSALIAIGLGALSLHVHEWYFNEGGSTPVIGLGRAFYFWMVSFGVLFIGTTVIRVFNEPGTKPPPFPSK